MRLGKLSSAIVLSFIFNQASGQDLPGSLDECSHLLALVEAKVGTLSKGETARLLNSVDEFCMRSTEFSEWVNEVLYAVLISQPRMFATTFEELSSSTQARIVYELAHPVHDAIDVGAARRALDSAGDDLGSIVELSRAVGLGAEATSISTN